MASLTETSSIARKAIKFGVIALAAFLLIRLVISVWTKYLKVIKPEPPPPPTVSFGKLPQIAFPQTTHPELTLRLETPTGGTPDLGDRATVYLMPVFRASFMALDEAKATAKKMKFVNEPKELTERRYRWENNEFLPSTLEMDIIDGSFVLERNWQSDPTTLTDKQLPGRGQVEIEAKNFLRQAGLLTNELEEAKSKVKYLTFSGGQYSEVMSLSEADFVEINLFRPDIEDIPTLAVNPDKGIIRMIFSGAKEAEKKVVLVEYNYFPVNQDQSATYPIKTASQAWKELQTRQGYIAKVGNNPEGVVTIRRIYLGYFDGNKSQGFLMPIIVFEGDNDFFGYVQAINNEWLQAPPPSSGI